MRIGMTTARTTGRVTLLPSEGFWHCGLELLELQSEDEFVERALRSDETLDRGSSTQFSSKAGCGRAMAFGNLL